MAMVATTVSMATTMPTTTTINDLVGGGNANDDDMTEMINMLIAVLATMTN